MTLTEFVAARLDEDEAAASHTSPAPWQATPLATYVSDANDVRVAALAFTEDGRHIARHDPARALREVAAKRAILAEHRQWVFGGTTGCSTCHAGHEIGDPPPGPCPTLRALAAVYSDHRDYDPAWAPGS